MNISRFQAFSDGIFAILITILVLQFQIPDYQVGHLGQALLNQWPILLSYTFSYFYVGTLWLFHHDFFGLFKKIDRNMNVINLILLFSVTLIDYPMSLVADTLTTMNRVDLKVALIVYDVVALIASAMFFVIYWYLHQHPELRNKKVNVDFYDHIQYDPVRSVAIYFAAIVITLFSNLFGAILLGCGIIFHFYAYVRLNAKIKKYHEKALIDNAAANVSRKQR
ncbi:TMEM175 family protein [Lapidilactobacillus bayanensis]|uniref:TMEM175 family protein n=1 Tax=Lapidilactobacillus bayanensis TaxID=2485998 RepID=UPI000F7B87DD|nr:TMEM175 family protein [Lapidilactobacillus bayanensis]